MGEDIIAETLRQIKGLGHSRTWKKAGTNKEEEYLALAVRRRCPGRAFQLGSWSAMSFVYYELTVGLTKTGAEELVKFRKN